MGQEEEYGCTVDICCVKDENLNKKMKEEFTALITTILGGKLARESIAHTWSSTSVLYAVSTQSKTIPPSYQWWTDGNKFIIICCEQEKNVLMIIARSAHVVGVPQIKSCPFVGVLRCSSGK